MLGAGQTAYCPLRFFDRVTARVGWRYGEGTSVFMFPHLDLKGATQGSVGDSPMEADRRRYVPQFRWAEMAQDGDQRRYSTRRCFAGRWRLAVAVARTGRIACGRRMQGVWACRPMATSVVWIAARPGSWAAGRSTRGSEARIIAAARLIRWRHCPLSMASELLALHLRLESSWRWVSPWSWFGLRSLPSDP